MQTNTAQQLRGASSPKGLRCFFVLPADSNVYRKPRWGFRRPVQTLVCSSVSFHAAREKKRKRILPGSSGAHPAQGCAVVRSGLLIDTIPLSFACPKERGKENDTQEGKISFSPPPENLPLRTSMKMMERKSISLHHLLPSSNRRSHCF